MDYDFQLQFVRKLLADLRIASCVFAWPEEGIPSEVDLGLRSLLYDTDNYSAILEKSLAEAREHTIYRFFDEYDCCYVFLRLPDGRYFFVGPYLLEIPRPEQIQRRAKNLALSDTKRRRLSIYYSDLPVIEDENWLLTLTNTLGETLWGSREAFSLEYMDYAIPDRGTPIPVAYAAGDPYDAPLSLTVLEDTYKSEALLMEAVSKGKLHLVTAVASSVSGKGAEERAADSLRNRKNNLIILKTLLRKAAEYGGVHPLHIHRLSSEHARRIEKICTVKESLQLQEEMIRDYCLLVKTHSLSSYSYYVGKAITLVQHDLTADLSLRALAAQLKVNGSYLSTLFRRELGCTLTEYVNRQRVQHAVLLLRDGSRRIQDVAAECGFQDATYFIRQFKKQFGITPAAYRERVMDNNSKE